MNLAEAIVGVLLEDAERRFSTEHLEGNLVQANSRIGYFNLVQTSAADEKTLLNEIGNMAAEVHAYLEAQRASRIGMRIGNLHFEGSDALLDSFILELQDLGTIAQEKSTGRTYGKTYRLLFDRPRRNYSPNLKYYHHVGHKRWKSAHSPPGHKVF